MERGALCTLSFRGSLEVGVILGVDASPPARAKLLDLVPVKVTGPAGWGRLLCDLADLFAATPRELVGYLLFTGPAQGLKLVLEAGDLSQDGKGLVSRLADLCGSLTPARRRKLMKALKWGEFTGAVAAGLVELRVGIAGLPEVTRPLGQYSRRYHVDPTTAKLLGLSSAPGRALPGTYLAGLTEKLTALNLVAVKPEADEETPPPAPPPPASKLGWEELAWPAWELLSHHPGIAEVALRRTQATWDRLRGPQGLPAELAADIAAGRRTLVIAPQAWMLDRVWPGLAAWAGHVHRYRADAGPGTVAAVLRAVEQPGQVVCGLEGAWKLAAYARFDRVVLIDPTHPAYAPEGAPWLDPRTALWRVLAGGAASLDLVEFGLSPFDGRMQLRQAAVLPPHEPQQQPQATGKFVDLDPLPLHLRQPGRRRLVYLNRLGQGRRLRCEECGQAVSCPRCNSLNIFYSGSRERYQCPDCGWTNPDLLCRNCGTATLSSALPGLEALTRREGDALVQGGGKHTGVHPENQSVFGTARLLEPLAEFWPQEIVYVHADAKPGLTDDWPEPIDLTSRLCALYANPHLQYAYIVSAQLRGRLGKSLTRDQVTELFKQDMGLRRLAGLPPFGRLLRFRWRGRDRGRILAASRKLLAVLGRDTPEAMLGVGQPYRHRDGHHLAGYAVNPQLPMDELQRIRCADKDVSLSVKVVWGPWAG